MVLLSSNHGDLQMTGDPSETSTTSTGRPGRILLVVGIGTLLGTLTGSAGNLALPVLAIDLGLTVDQVGWTVSAFLLTSTVFLLLVGRLGDLVGHRTLYQAGFVVMAVTSLICGLTDSFVVLVVTRAVQGVGGAMVMAAGPALITLAFPGSQRGRALGWLGTAAYSGLTVGPLVGGAVVAALSWRWLFFLYLPLAAIVVVLGRWFLPGDRPRSDRPTFDWAGAATLVGGLPLLLVALTQGNAWGWGSPMVLSCVAGGSLLLIAFAWIETGCAEPMLDLRLFRSRVFTGAVLSSVGNYAAQFVVVILLPFYLIEGLELPPARAGLLIAAQAVLMALSTSPSGRLSDRIGSRVLATTGLAVLAASLVGMTTLGPYSSPWQVALWMALSGLGAGIFISPNSSALMGAAPRAQQGIAAAVMAVARTLGMILGVALGTAIFAAGGGQTGEPWQVDDYAALRGALWAGAALCLLSALAAAVRGREARFRGRRRTRQSRRLTWARIRERLVAVALGLLVTLVLLEILLRLGSAAYWRGGATDSEAAAWFERSAAACPECALVLCLGDSFTYGIGASGGNSYPDQLQRLLDQEAERPARVHNGGIGGANTSTMRHRLDEFSAIAEPDAVVLLVGDNNGINHTGYSTWQRGTGVRQRLGGAVHRLRVVRFALLATRMARRDGTAWYHTSGDEFALLTTADVYRRWRARRGDPVDPDSPFGRGAELLAAGRHAEARELFDEAVQQSPADSSGYWGLGNAHRAAQQLGDAEWWYHEAVRVDPTDAVAWFGLAELRLDAQVHGDPAAAFFAAGVEADPSLGRNHCGLAYVQWQQGAAGQVRALFEAGVRADPDDDFCYPPLVDVARGGGDEADWVVGLLRGEAGTSEVARSYLRMLQTEAPEYELTAWMRDDLDTMVARCRELGVPILLLDYPHDTATNSVIEDVARDHGVTLVVLSEHFAGLLRAGRTRDELFVADGHPNDEGYGIMARLVADQLLAEGMLEEP